MAESLCQRLAMTFLVFTAGDLCRISCGGLVLGVLFATASCSTPTATGPRAAWDLETSANIVAEGYDLVAYYSGQALYGSDRFTANVGELTYRFASEENLAAFIAEPKQYQLAWGGWCAWAVANGGTWDADPESFIIREGRVFLFHHSIFYDAKQVWSEQPDEERLLRDGDRHWVRLSKEPGPASQPSDKR